MRYARGIFIANLIAQMGIVVTGALVRVTASGLGCPTWPECVDGSLIPTDEQTEQFHKYIEFGNRLLTFLLGILAIAAIVAGIAIWRKQRRKDLLLLSAVPIVGTLLQAVLGGITVLTGLNPWTVAAHFLVSIVIIAGVTILVFRSRPAADSLEPTAPVAVRMGAWLLVVVAFLVVVVGTLVTGSGPHSGDASAARMPFDPQLISWLHADLVLLFIGLLIGLLVASFATASPRRLRTWLMIVLGISVVQGIVGYTQYFTNLPWLLVAFHVLGAVVLWVSVLFAALAALPSTKHRISEDTRALVDVR